MSGVGGEMKHSMCAGCSGEIGIVNNGMYMVPQYSSVQYIVVYSM